MGLSLLFRRRLARVCHLASARRQIRPHHLCIPFHRLAALQHIWSIQRGAIFLAVGIIAQNGLGNPRLLRCPQSSQSQPVSRLFREDVGLMRPDRHRRPQAWKTARALGSGQCNYTTPWYSGVTPSGPIKTRLAGRPGWLTVMKDFDN